MVLTGIDHVIFAVADPDAAARQLEATLGLAVTGGGRHEAHGTYNRLVWLGDSYVELMGVFDETLAANSWWGGHMQAVLARGTDAQVGLFSRQTDLDATLMRLHAQRSALGEPVAGERRRPDGAVVRWRSARLPAPDPELGLVFVIEHDPSGAEWSEGDRAARAQIEMPGLGRVMLVRVELAVPDVARASMRLLRDFGIQFRPSLAGGGARDASLGAQTLRLVPLARGGRTAVVLRASALAEARRATLFGCDWVASGRYLEALPTTNVPVMFGWTSHWNVYVPAGSAANTYVRSAGPEKRFAGAGGAVAVDRDVVRDRVSVVEVDREGRVGGHVEAVLVECGAVARPVERSPPACPPESVAHPNRTRPAPAPALRPRPSERVGSFVVCSRVRGNGLAP